MITNPEARSRAERFISDGVGVEITDLIEFLVEYGCDKDLAEEIADELLGTE